MNQELPSFESLVQIAQDDPELLEKIRRQQTDNLINSAPIYLQPRLRGLQFKIDSTRSLAKTPLAACIKLTEMMHESFDQLRAALNGTLNRQPIELSDATKATILQFPDRQIDSRRQTS